MGTENLHLDEHSLASFLGGGRPERAPLRHVAECADCRAGLARGLLAAGLLPRARSDEAPSGDQVEDRHLSVRQIRHFHAFGFEGASGEADAFGIHALHLIRCSSCFSRLIAFRERIAPSDGALSLAQSAYQRGQSTRLGAVRIYSVGRTARLFVSSEESPELSHEERQVQRALSLRDKVRSGLDSNVRPDLFQDRLEEAFYIARHMAELLDELWKIRKEAETVHSERTSVDGWIKSLLGEDGGTAIYDPARFIEGLESPLREISKYDAQLFELRWQEQERLLKVRDLSKKLEAYAPPWMSREKFGMRYGDRYEKRDRFSEDPLAKYLDSLPGLVRGEDTGTRDSIDCAYRDTGYRIDFFSDYQSVIGPGFRLALRIVDDSGVPEIEVWATVVAECDDLTGVNAEPVAYVVQCLESPPSPPTPIAGLTLSTVDKMGKASKPILTDPEGRARLALLPELFTVRIGGETVNGVDYPRCRLDVSVRGNS
jgi:hypothetical protein